MWYLFSELRVLDIFTSILYVQFFQIPSDFMVMYKFKIFLKENYGEIRAKCMMPIAEIAWKFLEMGMQI